MNKRVTSAVMAAVMAAGSMGAVPAAADDTVKLTFYCNAVVQNDTPDIIAAFQEEYPNIEVEYVELPADSTKKNQTLSTILQAQDDSMDLFLLDTTWPESFTSAGWLEPLDDVVSEEERAEYVQGPIDACTIGGQLMALPVFLDAGVMLYRKDLLDKYNFTYPATWDEMKEQCKTIMAGEENMYGYVNSWKQYENMTCSALEYIKSYGGSILDEEGNVVINSPETAAGIQEMFDELYTDAIMDQGVNGYTTPDEMAIFNSGNAVFARAWTGNYKEANNPENSTVAGNVEVAALPAGPSGSFSCLGGWSVGVSAFSKHKEEAKAFAKFFSGEVGCKIRALAGGNLPVISSVYEDSEVVEKNPQFVPEKECADNAVGRPKSAYYAEVSDALQQGIGAVLTQTSSIEDALATMQTKLEEITSR